MWRRCLALALLAVAQGGCAVAADWVVSGRGTAGELFEIDAASITRRGDLVQSSMRQTLAKPVRDANTGRMYLQDIVIRFDDCAGRRYSYGDYARHDRNGLTVDTGRGSGEWHELLADSVGEQVWRFVCAVTKPPAEKAFLTDIGEGDWQDLGPSAARDLELFMRRDNMIRLDKDTVLFLSRSDYATAKPIGGFPIRHVVTGNLVDCKAMTSGTVGGDFYVSPGLRVVAIRKKAEEVELTTISPNSFVYENLKTICAPAVEKAAQASGEPSFATGTAWGVEKGYLVTASHVIQGGKTIGIVRGGERVGWAKVVADDPVNDVAILKPRFDRPGRLNVLSLAIHPASLGRSVFTLGYPEPEMLGQQVKMTAGEVSSTSGAGDDARFIQISVPLQPGNSGGPVMGWDGAVVGVADSVLKKFDDDEQGARPQMVNYAVKASYLRPLLDELPTLANYTVIHPKGSKEAVVAQARTAVYMLVVASDPAE